MGYRTGPEPWCAWLMPMVFLSCIAMFIYTMYVNNCPDNIWVDKCVMKKELGRFSFEPIKENPLFGPSVSTLRKVGGLERKLVQQGERWRLFSCMFLHSGVVHLFFNTFALLCTGVQLEEEFGFLKIGILYVLSGLGGSILSCLHQDPTKDMVSVGASGALFGFMGSMLSEFITNWSSHSNKCVQLMMLLVFICLNLLLGLIPGVDNMAHLGGFISGFFLGFVLLIRPHHGYVGRHYISPGYETTRHKPKYQCHQQLLWITSFVILIAGYMFGISLLFKGSQIDIFIPSIPIDDLENTISAQIRNATEHTT